MNTTSVPTNFADIYAAPASNPAAPKKLFSVPQLGVATFLAVPVGLTLMAINYRRIGKRFESNLAMILTPVVTMLLFAVGMALPAGAPTALVPFLAALGIKKISTQEFGKEIGAIESNGGRLESSWLVAGAVIVGVIVSFVLVIWLMDILNIG